MTQFMSEIFDTRETAQVPIGRVRYTYILSWDFPSRWRCRVSSRIHHADTRAGRSLGLSESRNGTERERDHQTDS